MRGSRCRLRCQLVRSWFAPDHATLRVHASLVMNDGEAGPSSLGVVGGWSFEPSSGAASDPQSEMLLNCPPPPTPTHTPSVFSPIQLRSSDTLAHYRLARSKYPSPHPELTEGEAIHLRITQTNPFPQAMQVHMIHPSLYSYYCKFCVMPKTLYHVVWECRGVKENGAVDGALGGPSCVSAAHSRSVVRSVLYTLFLLT